MKKLLALVLTATCLVGSSIGLVSAFGGDVHARVYITKSLSSDYCSASINITSGAEYTDISYWLRTYDDTNYTTLKNEKKNDVHILLKSTYSNEWKLKQWHIDSGKSTISVQNSDFNNGRKASWTASNHR